MNGIIPIDISQARSKLPSLVRKAANEKKTYEVRVNGIPMAKIIPADNSLTEEEKERRFKATAGSWKMTDEERHRRFLSSFGSWKMTDKEAKKMINEVYKLRKDGSDKKKFWE